MADFYFFTDYESFVGQDSGDEFGPISNTEYKLDTEFNLSAGAKVYAICDGHVLVQSNSLGDLNIILRPSKQPRAFNIGDVKYYVYRGISSASLVDATKVAQRTNNDLTEYAWSNQEITDTNTQSGPNDADKQVLGINYSSTGSGTFQVADSDSIDSVFFKEDDIQLIPVKAGDHIGDFVGGSTKGGLQILIDKLGTQITMETARALNHTFVPSTSLGSSSAEKTLHILEKEYVLSSVDPCSFFGMFNYGGLIVPTTSSNQYVTSDIVKKFLNKNRIYFDIRSEFDLSFNVFGDFNSDIGISLAVASPPSPLTFYDYYGAAVSNNASYGTWPIFIIEDTLPQELTQNNEHGKMLFEFQNTGAEVRAFHWREARKNGKKQDEFVYNDQSFQFELSSWAYQDGGSHHFGSALVCMKVVYEKRGSQQTFFPRSSDTLQTLFPINWLVTDISGQPNDVIIKAWQDSAIVEHIEYPEIFGDMYQACVGVAYDKESVTYFSYPSGEFGHKRREELMSNGKLMTSKHYENNDFYNVLNRVGNSVMFELREIDLNGFGANAIHAMSNGDSALTNKIEPRYLNTVSVTHDEKVLIDTAISAAGFVANTPISLKLNEEENEILSLPANEFRRVPIVVCGIKYVSNSGGTELEVVEIDTNIVVNGLIKNY